MIIKWLLGISEKLVDSNEANSSLMASSRNNNLLDSRVIYP